MTDSIITNFDIKPDNNPPDLVTYMRDTYRAMMAGYDREHQIYKERVNDPNWEWSAIHICNKATTELLLSNDTLPDIKHKIAMATFAGYRWVWVGEGPEPE